MNIKKNIDFMGKRKIYWIISLSIIVVGILFNLIFGAKLDIKFTGGSMFKYSYADDSVVVTSTDVSGSDVTPTDLESVVAGIVDEIEAEAVSGADVSAADVSATDIIALLADVVPVEGKNVDPDAAAKVISKALGEEVTVSVNTRLNIDANETDNKNLVVSLAENKAVDQNANTIITYAMSRLYPDVELSLKESNSVDPTMGKEFFWKCVIAVILASVFMVLYVALRFKKVGGWTAGVSGIIAILHDCLIVYFTFVIFRYPIDDNFIAVILAIIGYSLNSTIVIFDRIRENRRLLGPKVSVAELANVSMNETLGRTINTNLCVFVAIAVVAIVSVIFGLNSIMSFAVPMMFGTVSGCYSSLLISNSIWVTWQEAIAKKEADKKAEKKAAEKAKKSK
ncbi:MAG: hypothetical protein E7559_00865 [Ruminococcaceae bacterium]|nr:hypothetical protein [Oscillospiraceae bacterium]